MVSDFTSKNTCFEKGCSEKHHTSLHQYFLDEAKEASNKSVEEKSHNYCTGASGKTVILQIVPVSLHGEGGKSLDTYAILDNCSQSTLIREDVTHSLGLKRKEKIRVSP